MYTARHVISHRSFGNEFTLQFFKSSFGPSVVDAGKKITKILLKKDIKPRYIMTREAFENAIDGSSFRRINKCGNALDCYGSFG
jgi:transcriptional accessory protein Tex/SPT6